MSKILNSEDIFGHDKACEHCNSIFIFENKIDSKNILKFKQQGLKW